MDAFYSTFRTNEKPNGILALLHGLSFPVTNSFCSDGRWQRRNILFSFSSSLELSKNSCGHISVGSTLLHLQSPFYNA